LALGAVNSEVLLGSIFDITIALYLKDSSTLLFLDEPTSGLDSAASYYVMKRIKSLDHKDAIQRIVIASIHQLSAEVFQFFDNLCLLCAGKTVYFGPASAAIQDCADTVIGNWHLRGISGGEKRKVSIALEILMRPRLLFLDEPTSGLDRNQRIIDDQNIDGLKNFDLQVLRRLLDFGKKLPSPDALLINGQRDSAVFTDQA
ncbi:hypothetical protein S83_035335, partial [Arachis hypogaea]